MVRRPHRRLGSTLRRFMDGEANGGLVLMAAAATALVVANSPLNATYAAVRDATIAGHSVEQWINDALMVVFFLLVGLEIKREILHGQLRTWPSRLLPGLGALGGMVVPALVFVAAAAAHPGALRGWAIPSATDIAFALGVLSLLGERVPASLKVFLTALAVLDDLGAVVIIAAVYSDGLALPMLAGAAGLFGMLIGLNRCGVRHLAPYLLVGSALWLVVWRSGLHPTVAGVLIGLTIPDRPRSGTPAGSAPSPLQRLEQALGPWVAFGILPLFALANAGVAFGSADALLRPVTVAVAAGLVIGKQGGVMAALWLATRLRLVRRPAGASWSQVYGVALLCGIGFTMSLFIGLLAYGHSPEWLAQTKLGVLVGSLLSALAGTLVLRLAPAGRHGRSTERVSPVR